MIAVSPAQESAFRGGTFGLDMGDFQFSILAVLYALLYLWLAWLSTTLWKAWSQRTISLYALLTGITRGVLVTLLASFFLH